MAKAFIEALTGRWQCHFELLHERAQFAIHIGGALEIEPTASQVRNPKRIAEHLSRDVALARFGGAAHQQDAPRCRASQQALESTARLSVVGHGPTQLRRLFRPVRR